MDDPLPRKSVNGGGDDDDDVGKTPFEAHYTFPIPTFSFHTGEQE